MSGDMLLGVHISVLNTLVVFLHTHLFFSALIKQLYTHAYYCVNLHWLLYTALALLKGTLVNCSGFYFSAFIFIQPSPPAPLLLNTAPVLVASHSPVCHIRLR